MMYLLYINVARRGGVYLLTSIPLVVGLWYTAKGGTLYDITGLFALTYLLILLSEINDGASLVRLVGFAILAAILDLSRPFAFNICLLIFFYLALKIKWKAVLPIYIFILLVSPFHINQMAKFNTFELSTYGGNNLIEALDSNFLAADNCYAYELAKQLDTYEAAECAAINKRKVLEALKNDPSMISQTFNFGRLKKVLFPNLVWHATGLNPEERAQKIIQIGFYIGLVMVYVLGLVAILRRVDSGFNALLLLIAFYIISITLIANRLSEVLRVSLPALTVLTLLAQNCFPSKKSDNK